VIAAHKAIQRPPQARLLVIDTRGEFSHARRSSFVKFLNSGDLVVANNAATLPASLSGVHLRTGLSLEVRLAGRASLSLEDQPCFSAIVFGAGDYHLRTEDRPAPPALAPGDLISLGPLTGTVESLLNHPRLISIRFNVPGDTFWAGLSRHGRPIQYTHIQEPLAIWDTWTSIAGPPVAFEPPSAGFVLDWRTISSLRGNGIGFATITHAAGISSTGDPDLDRRLPFDEPYEISELTARLVNETRKLGRRIIAIGTTVVRALEHSASMDGHVHAGAGLATQRIDKTTQLQVVDGILSGTHETDTSHYQLLRAFADDDTLSIANRELDAHGYRTHEFGDSVLIISKRSPE